jgi:hypothetical protein
MRQGLLLFLPLAKRHRNSVMRKNDNYNIMLYADKDDGDVILSSLRYAYE